MGEVTRRYAEDTKVSVRRSIEEAREILLRYGVERFGMMEEPGWDTLGWYIGTTPYRLRVERTEGTDTRSNQEYKQRWRATCLYLKASLEFATASATPPEKILLPYAVLPDGRTVAEAAPQLTGSGWAAIVPKGYG